jgi:hypothetical protein
MDQVTLVLGSVERSISSPIPMFVRVPLPGCVAIV